MDGDRLLERIATVCSFHATSNWVLHYDSENGGAWAMTLSTPDEDEPPEEVRVPGLPFVFRKGDDNGPLFAMKCQELEVIVTALEHWHAAMAMKEA